MKNKKVILIVIISILVISIVGVTTYVIANSKSKENEVVGDGATEVTPKENDNVNIEEKNENQENNENSETDEKVDIVDINSVSRPFAISVNNTPVAVKVQEGLNKAYLVYEIPTEGNTSRLLALFKDSEDVTVGTIRSARHNFIDYALESDAIFVCYGWSHYAQDDMQKNKSINFIQGLFGGPFWRNNPENLASEHTAYTSIGKLKDNVKSSGVRAQSDSAGKTMLLKYNTGDVDISSMNDAKVAKTVDVPYGAGFDTKFEYDENAKQYNRIENDEANVDYNTKEQFTAKNIIVQKITYSMCDDNYYWNLNTTGSGTGYFITNGYAVPIKWSKPSRTEKTKYTYMDGTEIEVSDGRTFIEIQTTSQNLTISE